MSKFGPMDINFRVRAAAVVPAIEVGDYYMPEHQKIFYGLDAVTIVGIQTVVFDLDSPYAKLSVGGRRPGNPIEEEWKKRRHHFNKRIMTDEERQAGQARPVQAAAHYGYSGVPAVQGGGDVGGFGALDGEGSIGSIEEVEATAGCAGRGDSGAGNEEEVTS